MNKIEYRKANLDDLETLYDLSVDFETFNKQNSTNPEEHFAKDWQTFFRNEIDKSLHDPNSTNYIALDDGTPIGYIYCRKCDSCLAFYIDEMYVNSHYQGKGIGKMLLQMAVELGKQYDYDIKLEVFDWNKSALEFYKKSGFRPDSVSMVYEV